MAFPWAAAGAIIPPILNYAAGRSADAAARRQNRRNRSQDARHASQVDPFVTALQNFDTSPLRDFDTSALKEFSGDELREFAAQMQNQANQGPALGRIGGRVSTSPLRNMDTSLNLGDLRASDTRGLKAAARRNLDEQRGSLQSNLASRGLMGSGLGNIEQRRLQADVMSNLAGDINQDQFQREQAALGFERGGQQLKAQNLAEALGLGVQQRGQDITQRGQDLSSMDRRAGLAGDFLAEALGLEQRGLETGLGMDLDALGQALGLDLSATMNAGQMVMNTPGFADYNRENQRFQEGVDGWAYPPVEAGQGPPGMGDSQDFRPGQGGGGNAGAGGYTPDEYTSGTSGGGEFTGGAYADLSPGPPPRPYDTGRNSIPPNVGPGQSSGGVPPNIGPSPEARPMPGPRIPRGQALRAGGDGSAFGVQGSLQDIFGGGGGGQNSFSPEIMNGLMQALSGLTGGQGAGMGGFSPRFNASRNSRARRRNSFLR